MGRATKEKADKLRLGKSRFPKRLGESKKAFQKNKKSYLESS